MFMIKVVSIDAETHVPLDFPDIHFLAVESIRLLDGLGRVLVSRFWGFGIHGWQIAIWKEEGDNKVGSLKEGSQRWKRTYKKQKCIVGGEALLSMPPALDLLSGVNLTDLGEIPRVRRRPRTR